MTHSKAPYTTNEVRYMAHILSKYSIKYYYQKMCSFSSFLKWKWPKVPKMSYLIKFWWFGSSHVTLEVKLRVFHPWSQWGILVCYFYSKNITFLKISALYLFFEVLTQIPRTNMLSVRSVVAYWKGDILDRILIHALSSLPRLGHDFLESLIER